MHYLISVVSFFQEALLLSEQIVFSSIKKHSHEKKHKTKWIISFCKSISTSEYYTEAMKIKPWSRNNIITLSPRKAKYELRQRKGFAQRKYRRCCISLQVSQQHTTQCMSFAIMHRVMMAIMTIVIRAALIIHLTSGCNSRGISTSTRYSSELRGDSFDGAVYKRDILKTRKSNQCIP